MKKILIPLDFKYNRYAAIEYAVNFFKREECEFYFLNTYTYDVGGLNAIHLLQANEDWFEKPKNDSVDNLGDAILKFTFNHSSRKHRFHAISECSDLIDGIKKTIKDVNIDLVILAGKNSITNKVDRYNKSTIRILENIRECPVMIIPQSSNLKKCKEFVLVSNFEIELPQEKIAKWYELVKIVKGTVKLVVLTGKNHLTALQTANLENVCSQIEMLANDSVDTEYLENAHDLKQFAKNHSESIICLMDRKPDIWRKYGLSHSRITNLGPLKTTPLIALHR